MTNLLRIYQEFAITQTKKDGYEFKLFDDDYEEAKELFELFPKGHAYALTKDGITVDGLLIAWETLRKYDNDLFYLNGDYSKNPIFRSKLNKICGMQTYQNDTDGVGFEISAYGGDAKGIEKPFVYRVWANGKSKHGVVEYPSEAKKAILEVIENECGERIIQTAKTILG